MPKGSKASALDAALQYVKNKLPRMGFFSTLDEVIGAAPFEKAPFEQWQNYLKPGRTFEREGVRFPLKQEELDYVFGNPLFKDEEGDYYRAPDSVMTKDELRDLVRNLRPDFSLYVGASFPARFKDRFPEEWRLDAEGEEHPRWSDIGETRGAIPRMTTPKYGDYAFGQDLGFSGSPEDYSGGPRKAPYEESSTRSTDFGPFDTHFGPDVISHSRTTVHPTDEPLDRGLVTGTHEGRQKLMRLIEEIQSDRHQAAAEKFKITSGGRYSVNSPPALNDDDARRIWNESPMERRGYRTPKEERQILEMRDQEGHIAQWLQEQAQRLRRNPQNQDIQAADQARLNLIAERVALEEKIPDAPFKDPADYALLELKNQLLNAANEGQDYLGLIRGSDVSRRFSHEPSEAKGTSYVYDQVYPSVMRKLANQYGAEVKDVGTHLKSSVDVATTTMRELDSETTNDLLAGARDIMESSVQAGDFDVGNGAGIGTIENVLEEMADKAPDEAARAKRTLDYFTNEYTRLQDFEHPDVKSWWEQLKEDMGTAHEEYARKVRQEAGVTGENKTFPSIVLTPEVRERIKKAGVPIWSLAGLGASTIPSLMTREEDQPAFAEGGEVSGIERLRQLAENVGTEDTVDRRKRILSGLASQWYGVNPDTDDVEFLGGASLLPKIRSLDEVRDRYRHFNETGEFPDEGRPGIIDEIQSMLLGTDKADRADARLEELKNRIREKMQVGEAHGFGENFDEALGTMIGQVPMPMARAKKAVEAATRLEKLKKILKAAPNAVLEWLTPTVEPSPMNYLTGATVGGGIGALVSPTPTVKDLVTKAEGGEVKAEATAPLHGLLDMWKSRLGELSAGLPNMPAVGDNAGSGFEELQMKAKGGKVSSAIEAIVAALKSRQAEDSSSKIYRHNPDLERMARLIHERLGGGSQTLNLGLKTPVLKNPTQDEVMRFTGRDIPEIRMMTDRNGDTYVWDADAAIHPWVMKKLGIDRSQLYHEMSDTPISPKDYESWLYSDPWN